MRPAPSSPLRPRPAAPRAGSGTARGITEFLGAHDTLGALLPTAMRMAELQQECARGLPAMFAGCAVLQFAAGQLVLAVPTAALAAKLKQQLPKLQDQLCRLGWQVNAVRLKVQAAPPQERPAPPKRLSLPPQALPALAALDSQLADTPRNAALKAAIETMLRRHRGGVT